MIFHQFQFQAAIFLNFQLCWLSIYKEFKQIKNSPFKFSRKPGKLANHFPVLCVLFPPLQFEFLCFHALGLWPYVQCAGAAANHYAYCIHVWSLYICSHACTHIYVCGCITLMSVDIHMYMAICFACAQFWQCACRLVLFPVIRLAGINIMDKNSQESVAQLDPSEVTVITQ